MRRLRSASLACVWACLRGQIRADSAQLAGRCGPGARHTLDKRPTSAHDKRPRQTPTTSAHEMRPTRPAREQRGSGVEAAAPTSPIGPPTPTSDPDEPSGDEQPPATTAALHPQPPGAQRSRPQSWPTSGRRRSNPVTLQRELPSGRISHPSASATHRFEGRTPSQSRGTLRVVCDAPDRAAARARLQAGAAARRSAPRPGPPRRARGPRTHKRRHGTPTPGPQQVAALRAQHIVPAPRREGPRLAPGPRTMFSRIGRTSNRFRGASWTGLGNFGQVRLGTLQLDQIWRAFGRARNGPIPARCRSTSGNFGHSRADSRRHVPASYLHRPRRPPKFTARRCALTLARLRRLHHVAQKEFQDDYCSASPCGPN